MRLRDIKNQKTWVRQVPVMVKDVTKPMDHPDGGLVQSVDVIFSQGVEDSMQYRYTDPAFSIDLEEKGSQWYDIKWMGGWLKCKPADAKKEEPRDDYPDWDAIALGKCRHKHVDKLLERMMPAELLGKPKELEAINKLVEFEAKGTT